MVDVHVTRFLQSLPHPTPLQYFSIFKVFSILCLWHVRFLGVVLPVIIMIVNRRYNDKADISSRIDPETCLALGWAGMAPRG